MEENLDKTLKVAFEAAFNAKNPTPIQKKCLDNLSAFLERDILIGARTGTGKTLAYLLPLLHWLLVEQRRATSSLSTSTSAPTRRAALGTQILILVPTRELAIQTQAMLVRLLAKLHGRDHWLVSGALCGGDRRKSEKERLRRGIQVVVGTPGRVLDHLRNTASWKMALSACRWLVLDEADRLLDSGFAKMVKEVIGILKETITNFPRIIFCSATVDEARYEMAGITLKDPLLLRADPSPNFKKSPLDAPNMPTSSSTNSLVPTASLEHFFICTPTKFRLATLAGLLTDIFSGRKRSSSITTTTTTTTFLPSIVPKVVLFSICCDTVDFLFNLFNNGKLGLFPRKGASSLLKLHGNMEHKERLKTFTSFVNAQDGALLVCTDIAARGLNLHQVTDIIQYDAPCDINDYVHRAGRTARENESGGRSILFLMPSERDYLPSLQEKGLKVNALPWIDFTETFLKRHPATKSITKQSQSTNDIDENVREEREVSLIVKRLNLILLENLQKSFAADSQLVTAAQMAYLSFVRAYATHPKSEKAIFHVKKLHLGHLAATYLLAEAPKKFSGRQAINDQEPQSNGKRSLPPSALAPPMKKFKLKKKMVSEFDAGDVDSSFMRPRNT